MTLGLLEYNPAIMRQDFNWALATGIVYSIPFKELPLKESGAREPSSRPFI